MNVSWKAVPKKVKKVGIRYPGIFSQNIPYPEKLH